MFDPHWRPLRLGFEAEHGSIDDAREIWSQLAVHGIGADVVHIMEARRTPEPIPQPPIVGIVFVASDDYSGVCVELTRIVAQVETVVGVDEDQAMVDAGIA